MRARARLAWVVLTGRVETKSSVGLLLTSLTVKELASQETEIRMLRSENMALKLRVVELTSDPKQPYR